LVRLNIQLTNQLRARLKRGMRIREGGDGMKERKVEQSRTFSEWQNRVKNRGISHDRVVRIGVDCQFYPQAQSG
jgi:hypothetical protein